MILEQLLKIENTDLNFDFFKHKKPSVLDRHTNILILPSLQQHDAFHNGTIEVFSYLQEKIGENNVEIFSSDEEYKEIALHSKAHWIGVFLIAQIAIPIFTNVISNYISDELQAKSGDEIDLNVIIENKNGNNIKVSYHGNAEYINNVLDKINTLSRGKDIETPSK